jgi:hypothetical protein
MQFRKRSSRFSDIINFFYIIKRGYCIIGNTVTLQVINSGSIPDISKFCAREAQLVEQNIEAIWVVSSSLTSSNKVMMELVDMNSLGLFDF